jgi:hypothetical protein
VLDSILITDYSSNYPENVDTVAKVEYGYYNNLKLKNSTEFYWNPGYSIWYKGHDRYYSYYQDGLLSELNTYYWRDNDIYQKRKKEYSYNNKNLLIEEKITRIKPHMVIPQSPNILSNMIISIALVCTLGTFMIRKPTNGVLQPIPTTNTIQ